LLGNYIRRKNRIAEFGRFAYRPASGDILAFAHAARRIQYLRPRESKRI
jgi:hypothetical protein